MEDHIQKRPDRSLPLGRQTLWHLLFDENNATKTFLSFNTIDSNTNLSCKLRFIIQTF